MISRRVSSKKMMCLQSGSLRPIRASSRAVPGVGHAANFNPSSPR